MSDPALRRQVARLASELARTQAEVHTLRRGARRPQLGNSSIDSGSLDVVDSETGQVRLRLGYQPDGSVGMVPEGGDPHPAPSAPVVEPIPSGLSVVWNGSLDGLEVLPADFDHVNVHVSNVDGFIPDNTSFVGTITRAGGVLPVAPLEVGATYYVVLVPVGTGGVQGAPSPQASGVPAPVGGVPGPGSITETEIADDAISTPKLQAEAVTALKIAAQAIEAGHIQAAAITASKLEADLVLGTRIIAGNPAGARVELDKNGLRGYDNDDALVFAVDDGNAVFTGTVTGSEITGSRFTMGSGDVTGQIEAVGSNVTQRVLSGPRQAQLFAGETIAEFSARLDTEDPSSPAAALYAMETQVGLTIDSSRLSADGLPSVTGTAFPGLAQLVLWSERNNNQTPFVALTADSGEVLGAWSAGDGSEVRLRATSATASALFTPPTASDPNDRSGPGYVFATRNANSHVAAVSLQSPRWEEPGSPTHHRRSIIFAEGANPAQPYARITQAARRVQVMGESTGSGYDTTTDGTLELLSTHSILAPRHAPLETVLDSNPTFSVSGSYVDFTAAQMPTIDFKTGWSGRVKISIMSAGYNATGNDTNLRLAFRLSGAQTIAAAPTRGTWMTNSGIGSTSRHMSTRIVVMNLQGNAAYTLHPQWYSSNNSGAVTFSVALGNTIIVEPLM